MALLSITASGQWWSATNGWFSPSTIIFPPAERNGRMSVTVTGALTNGTVIVLRRRLKAAFNGGTAGTAVQVLVVNAAYVAGTGVTGFSDDFGGINTAFEYDIGCPMTFGNGDTVAVELS